MKTIDQYLQHAAACREMARSASPAHRKQLEQMAETWEQLAQRHRQLGKMSSDRGGLIIEFELPPDDEPPKH